MRKLPETLAKVIREFEKEDGGLVVGCFVRWPRATLAPDDDAIEANVVQARIAVLAPNGELSAEGEFPPGNEPHAAFIKGDLMIDRLLIETAIEHQMGSGCCDGADAFSHGGREVSNHASTAAGSVKNGSGACRYRDTGPTPTGSPLGTAT
jgi:hypothetical protein